jgi:type IV pilus assembly protein PilZ
MRFLAARAVPGHHAPVTLDPGRRRSTRMAIELTVEYKRLNAFFADYTKNISRGGTFIRTDKPLAIGTDFVFKLHVPNLPEPLALRGRVQWIVEPPEATPEQEAGMGIGFVWESEAERERIANHVERLMTESLGSVIYDKLVGRRRRDEGED